MKNNTITFILFLILFSVSSCSNQKDKIKYIEVFSLEKGITTQFPVKCNMILKSQFKDVFSYKKINEKRFISKFQKLFKEYSYINNDDAYSIRIKILIHYNNNKIDTLCLGEHFNSFINEKRVDDNPLLLKIIKKEINYDIVP